MPSSKLPDLLSIVAVPIGNVGDLTPRARQHLDQSHLIFCEDKRKTADLLKRSESTFSGKLISVPGGEEFTTDWRRYCSLENRKWALVSDAGTPMINDPGKSVIDFCRSEGVRVVALPGASALTLALQWSGGFGLPMIFGGFAPKIGADSDSKWKKFFPHEVKEGTFSFFDSKHQILNTLEYLNRSFPLCRLFIAREMTKDHEELLSGNPDFLLKKIKKMIQADQVGELSVVVDLSSLNMDLTPSSESVLVSLTIEDLVRFRASSPKEASKNLAKWTNLSSKEAYKRLCDDIS